MHKLIAAIASAACLLCSSAVQAETFRLDFTASDFRLGMFNNSALPQSTITGSIVFSAASYGAEVTSIDAIDLTIAGHSYTADEVGAGFWNDGYIFGGNANGGFSSNMAGTNDFSMIYSSTQQGFIYVVPGIEDAWDTNTLTGTLTGGSIPAVPEPSMFAMMGLGFAGLLAARRRAKRQG